MDKYESMSAEMVTEYYTEGFDDGFKEGYDTAMEVSKREIGELLKELQCEKESAIKYRNTKILFIDFIYISLI